MCLIFLSVEFLSLSLSFLSLNFNFYRNLLYNASARYEITKVGDSFSKPDQSDSFSKPDQNVTKMPFWQEDVSSAPIFIIRRVGGFQLARQVEDEWVCRHADGRGSKYAAAAFFVHQPFFSRLRLFLFTSRSSRSCGFFCSPAVLLAAPAFFHHLSGS